MFFSKEMFIKSFAREAWKSSESSDQLDYQNFADIVANDEKFQFLNGLLNFFLFLFDLEQIKIDR